MSPLAAPASYDDILAQLGQLPGFHDASAIQAQAHDRTLTKPPGALGRLEDIARWLAGWQHRHPPKLDRVRILIFAANHGVTRHPVSAFPSAVTAQMVQNFAAGGAAINQLADHAGADLRVIDAGVDHPTHDFSETQAMDMAEFCAAFALGWTAVSADDDLIALGEMGIGNTTSAATICHALFGGKAMDWTGPGTGVEGAALSAKTAIVAKSVKRHEGVIERPLELFAALGGKELAAIAGAVLSARLQRVPVLLDGYITTAAIAPLCAIDRHFAEHCQPAHLSAEPAHVRLLTALGLPKPLLDLGMRLGEGSGAALGIGVVRAALACHNQMATFQSAGVSGKTEGAP